MQIIRLSDSSEIRIVQKEFREQIYLDVRKWYMDFETHEWCPTKKGIMFPLDLASMVRDGMLLEIGVSEEGEELELEGEGAPDFEIGTEPRND